MNIFVCDFENFDKNECDYAFTVSKEKLMSAPTYIDDIHGVVGYSHFWFNSTVNDQAGDEFVFENGSKIDSGSIFHIIYYWPTTKDFLKTITKTDIFIQFTEDFTFSRDMGSTDINKYLSEQDQEKISIPGFYYQKYLGDGGFIDYFEPNSNGDQCVVKYIVNSVQPTYNMHTALSINSILSGCELSGGFVSKRANQFDYNLDDDVKGVKSIYPHLWFDSKNGNEYIFKSGDTILKGTSVLIDHIWEYNTSFEEVTGGVHTKVRIEFIEDFTFNRDSNGLLSTEDQAKISIPGIYTASQNNSGVVDSFVPDFSGDNSIYIDSSGFNIQPKNTFNYIDQFYVFHKDWYDEKDLNGDYIFEEGHKFKKGDVIYINYNTDYQNAKSLYLLITKDYILHRNAENQISRFLLNSEIPTYIDNPHEISGYDNSGMWFDSKDNNGDYIFPDGHTIQSGTEFHIKHIWPYNNIGGSYQETDLYIQFTEDFTIKRDGSGKINKNDQRKLSALGSYNLFYSGYRDKNGIIYDCFDPQSDGKYVIVSNQRQFDIDQPIYNDIMHNDDQIPCFWFDSKDNNGNYIFPNGYTIQSGTIFHINHYWPYWRKPYNDYFYKGKGTDGYKRDFYIRFTKDFTFNRSCDLTDNVKGVNNEDSHLWFDSKDNNGNYIFPNGYTIQSGTRILIDHIWKYNTSFEEVLGGVHTNIRITFIQEFTFNRDQYGFLSPEDQSKISIPGIYTSQQNSNDIVDSFVPDISGQHSVYMISGETGLQTPDENIFDLINIIKDTTGPDIEGHLSVEDQKKISIPGFYKKNNRSEQIEDVFEPEYDGTSVVLYDFINNKMWPDYKTNENIIQYTDNLELWDAFESDRPCTIDVIGEFDYKKRLSIPGNFSIDQENYKLDPHIAGNKIIYNNDSEQFNVFYKTSINLWEVACPNRGEMIYKPYHFKTVGVTNEYYALQWQDNYNEVGFFNLQLPISKEALDLYIPGRYLLIEDSPKVMIIEKVVTNAQLKDNGYLMTVTGRSIESILDRRVAFPGKGLNTIVYKGSGGLVKGIKDLINGYFVNPMEIIGTDKSDEQNKFYYPERKIEFIELNEDSMSMNRLYSFKRDFNAGVNKNISKDDLLSVVSDLCQKNNLGFALVPANRYGGKSIQWEFLLYTGSDKSYFRKNKESQVLIFSPSSGNVSSLSTTKDNTNNKNVIFCAKEKDTANYIDLSSADIKDPDSEYSDVGQELADSVNFLGTTGKWLVNKLKGAFGSSEEPYDYSNAAILALVVAASDKDQGYDKTVNSINDAIIDNPEEYFLNNYYQALTGVNFTVNYNLQSARYDINDGGYRVYQKTGDFNTTSYDDFLKSTAYGWLNTAILKYANQLVNKITNSVSRDKILNVLTALDAYTSSYTLTKWLCETYSIGSPSGIDRREAFVDEEASDDDDWTNSKMISFSNSTELVTATDDGEESDEDIKKRLKETARKRSSEFTYQHYIDAKCEIYDQKYNEDYELGDIVQVDDDYGETNQYILNSVVIADDINSGYQIIPSFSKYNEIPEAYTRIEYLSVANMKLPYIFNESSEGESSLTSSNLGIIDIGSDTSGIKGIFKYKKVTWTEIEMEAAYERTEEKAENTPMAILSTGTYIHRDEEYDNIIDRTIDDFSVFDCDSVSPPNFDEIGGSKYNDALNVQGERFIILEKRKSFKVIRSDTTDSIQHFGNPITFFDDINDISPNENNIPDNSRDLLIRVDSNNNFRKYILNKPEYIYSADGDRNRKRLFSRNFIIDEDGTEHSLGDIPEFSDIYNIRQDGKRGYSCIPYYNNGDYIRDNSNANIIKPSGGPYSYNTADFNVIEQDFNERPSAISKNIYIAGLYNNGQTINYYTDTKKGLKIKEILIYEYSSAYFEYYIGANDSIIKNSNEIIVVTQNSIITLVSYSVDPESRRLAHRLIPVRYSDFKDEDIPKEEQYGLYDTVEGEFIPVNYDGFGIFIEAGGDIRKD